jgi:hypothetical protein
MFSVEGQVLYLTFLYLGVTATVQSRLSTFFYLKINTYLCSKIFANRVIN